MNRLDKLLMIKVALGLKPFKKTIKKFTNLFSKSKTTGELKGVDKVMMDMGRERNYTRNWNNSR
jgi:hypothetical protein